MKIEDRIIRRSQEDIIEIGSALEAFYNGPAGTIVRALANQITMEQFTSLEDNKTSSDKKLGRAEGVNMLIHGIELAIDDMQRLTVEIKEEQKLED